VAAWDSTELAFRFMVQAYGVRPYATTPEDLVRSYSSAQGGELERVDNGTTGVAPQPGDVISFDHQIGSGHVAVVAASSVDAASGNGSVTLLSQNDTTNGWRTVQVTGWTVRGFAQSGLSGVNIPSGWLHQPPAHSGGGSSGGRVDVVGSPERAPRPDTPELPAPPAPPRPPRP
jgi:hypothetical protein